MKFIPISILILALAPLAFAGASSGAAAAGPLATDVPESRDYDTMSVLGLLREGMEAYMRAPRRSRYDTALHSAWRSILKPRAGRMLRRVRRLSEPRYWTFDGDDLSSARMRPESWRVIVRELVTLRSELGGALRQYERVRVRVLRTANRRPSRSGWSESPRAREAAERAATTAQKMVDGVAKGIADTKERLRYEMLVVRLLLDALQKAEEHRLGHEVRAVSDAGSRRDALVALRRLTDTRLEAQIAASASDRYASVARTKWMQARSRVLKVLSQTAHATR